MCIGDELMNHRKQLENRFSDRLSVDPRLGRHAVSYQGNKGLPGLRWMKYKEGFSKSLVERFVHEKSPRDLLDPFSGLGTAPLVASGNGVNATGIEIMPVGVLAATGIAHAANGLDKREFHSVGKELLHRLSCRKNAGACHQFPHVGITEKAFPEDTEQAIAKAREFIDQIDDPTMRDMLNLACMSILESVSFTRKDGQYLRWDYRSGRPLRSHVDLGEVLDFSVALETRLQEMEDDIDDVKEEFGSRYPRLLSGSCLELLRELPDASFDLIVTSPPYANRYDYTRTYALELAWLGLDKAGFSDIRQKMITATVENKPKLEWLNSLYSDGLEHARAMYAAQGALKEIIDTLNENREKLSNKNIIRLIEGYFFEMAVVISEIGRILRPGGGVVMVNDNVQYKGEEIPVDFILSDFAEQSGMVCKKIWALPRGKGNSSQQMAVYGRREIRKCVYEWVKV